ncbi:3'(2'),5'-bisphosphate nucleotidase CysQ [Pasteurella multocida]|uniref:3'(2'),5'-bisphosphate nucleotidase CysQ n=1 Tax=Pasteurella multocida TaxID=747 RepID=UPI00202400DD|nr:3'(2'),5'-bisphosphate nucleotidase CysQ [Pasteurella multocida]URJ99979.1 3'(2'),5'-bisphosphate nucleotidase CysQ [Pasteurella multocida]
MLALSPSLLEKTLEIADQAGDFLTRFYTDSGQNALAIQTKQDNTPVTAVDLFLSQFLIEKLTALTPEVPILSEESCKTPLQDRAHWAEYWLIDPLDGTQQFINRTDQFSILITLVQHNQPVLSITHAPILQTTYYAMQGFGAYRRQGNQQEKLNNQARPEQRKIKIAVGVGGVERKIQPLLNPAYQYEFLVYGSSGLKGGLVADGTCDCYIRVGKTGEWDTGAAEILLREMGGAVFDFAFQPLSYNQRESFINPNFVMVANTEFDWQKIFQFHSH